MMTDRARDPQVHTLERLFHRKPVVVLDEMSRALGASGRTVYRALDRLGYLASYSHAGRYYTLRRIPKFDVHGLWRLGDIRFSTYGTLRATVVVLVGEAPAGRAHEELEGILGLRVHDTLRSLVEAHALGREQVESVYVYLDPDPERAAAQLQERRGTLPGPTSEPTQRAGPAVEPQRVIEVLVAVIHAPKDDARAIAAHLRAGGLAVSNEQVDAVFAQYALEKKTARSRSPRSRR